MIMKKSHKEKRFFYKKGRVHNTIVVTQIVIRSSNNILQFNT